MRPHRLVYLKCNEHVAVYNMTLKLSNVKRRFGYALNFFHHELNSSDVFFCFLTVLFALCVTRSLSILKTLYCPVHLPMTEQSRSQSQSRVVESRLHLWARLISRVIIFQEFQPDHESSTSKTDRRTNEQYAMAILCSA